VTKVPKAYKMKVLSTNVQSPKQLNAPSIVVTQMQSSQMKEKWRSGVSYIMHIQYL